MRGELLTALIGATEHLCAVDIRPPISTQGSSATGATKIVPLLLEPQVGIPQLEGAAQLAVKHVRPCLEQQMSASGCPLLLLLVEAFVQQGIDQGPDKSRRNH